jgi:hypothetical protein
MHIRSIHPFCHRGLAVMHGRYNIKSLLVSLRELLGCRFALLRVHPLPTADRLRLASSHL